jgi:hypothetical protein
VPNFLNKSFGGIFLFFVPNLPYMDDLKNLFALISGLHIFRDFFTYFLKLTGALKFKEKIKMQQKH